MNDSIPSAWLVLGLGGQGLFAARFVVQWIASERRGTSVVPRPFWWLSIAGGLCLLVYAILRRDPVIVVGQSCGLLIYARNLMLSATQGAAVSRVDVPPDGGHAAPSERRSSRAK